MNKLTKINKTVFVFLISGIGLLLLQIPIISLAGSKAHLTLFEFFAPITTSFIGLIPGLFSIALIQAINLILHGPDALDIGALIHFFPMLFAGLYFWKKNAFVGIALPILAILIFNLSDTGREVWYYSLFWTIPIISHFGRVQSLIMRSLGSTFMAHAVGGAVWIHLLNIPKAVWDSLIPVVIIERILFAIGITLTYIAFCKVIEYLEQKNLIKPEIIKLLLPERK